MPNMRTVSQDDRARMAKVYMREGMAPYQAARNTGFRTTDMMQEAIRMMEAEDRDEARRGQTAEAARRFGPERKPVETIEQEETPEERKEQAIYPFMKAGQVAAPEGGVAFNLATDNYTVKTMIKDGQMLVQVTAAQTSSERERVRTKYGPGVLEKGDNGRREKAMWEPITGAEQSPCPTEEVEQTCLFRWAAYASGAYPELKLLHAIPNGGKRGKAEAGRMKAAGVRAGVPDMCLPVARQGRHGLYIELKRVRGGRVSREQTAWMDELARQGYRIAICHGWEEARRVIEEYLREESEETEAQRSQ